MTVSAKLQLIFDQAEEIAHASDTHLCSVHILLSYFVVESPARSLLYELKIDESRLLEGLSSLGRESDTVLDTVTDAAWCMVSEKKLSQLDSVLYLQALLRHEASLVAQLLAHCKIDANAIDLACESFHDHHLTTLTTTDMRETQSFGSIDDHNEAEYVFAQQKGYGRSLARSHDTDSERRSHSPGRRRSDKLDRAGSRKDRSPRKTGKTNTFSLNEKDCPTLAKLAINLSEKAAAGSLEPVIGRQDEITEILDILSKKRSNNPLLIGETGVGKTALVEGVVSQIVAAYLAKPEGMPKIVMQLDTGTLLAGTHLRGALSERLKSIQEEVKRSEGQIFIFIDELHSLFGQQSEGGADAANELKLALSRGEFPCIGATTIKEFREHIEVDPALSRRFTTVTVEEPSPSETETIIYGLLSSYESHHAVVYEKQAVDDAIRLGRRYLYEQRDPDRSLGILDWAGAIAKRSGSAVSGDTVRQVISKATRIPMEHLNLNASARFLEIERTLSERILGQPHVAKVIGDTLIRNLAGFSGQRPIGSMLFIGPTGVGKTEVVKTLAELVFGSGEALTRFDMSEFSESHTVSRLIGSPPGYVGHQDGGQLTETVLRRPYQVILLDEIEKAHRDIWHLLLQITDEGHLSDSRGRRVDFSNALVIMTSNLGAQFLKPQQRGVGFAAGSNWNPAAACEKVLDFAKNALPIELWNRLDARLVFNPLEKETIIGIAQLLVTRSRAKIHMERDIQYEVTANALAWIVENGGFDWELGARPLRGAIAKWLETPISSAILNGTLGTGQTMHIDLVDQKLCYNVLDLPTENTLTPAELSPPA